MENEKKNDDYVLTNFTVGEEITDGDVDRFIHDNRDNFYSAGLEAFLLDLPSITEGIPETGVYKNDALDRWEYWQVIIPEHRDKGFENERICAFCLYSEKMLGFSKWTQEVDEMTKDNYGYIGPSNLLN